MLQPGQHDSHRLAERATGVRFSVLASVTRRLPPEDGRDQRAGQVFPALRLCCGEERDPPAEDRQS